MRKEPWKLEATHLGVSLHVLQKLAQQGEGEVDVSQPELVEADQGVGCVAGQCFFLGRVYVPADQDVHCVLESKGKLKKISSYIMMYSVIRTIQSALHFTHWLTFQHQLY